MTEDFLQSTDTYTSSLIISSNKEHQGFNTPEAFSHSHGQFSQRTFDNEDLTQLTDAYH